MKLIILNLKEVRYGKTDFQIKSTSEELELENIEYPLSSTITTHIKIYKNRNNYEMKLDSDFSLKLTCSRCLNEFEKQFQETAIFYLKEGVESFSKDYEFSEEDAYTIFFTEDQIDVAPLIREQVLLSIPLKPLCSDSCQIPKAENKSKKVDPRWKKLLEIKNRF
jgi:uncharacterized protein